MPNIDQDLAQFSALQTRRAPWDKMYELIARYMFSRKQGFITDVQSGEFLVHGDVYDDTAVRANNIMASSLVGTLWKNGARTFRYTCPKEIKQTPQIKEYYRLINLRAIRQIEHEKAGLEVALNEEALESGAFGTSAIAVLPAKTADHVIDYKSLELKNLYICENSEGRVDTIFYRSKLKATQMVDEYPEIAAHTKIDAAIKANNYTTEFTVVWIVRPRKNYNPSIENNINLPFESLHIWVDEKILLRESGYKSFPTMVTRFYKNPTDEYGYCPGMEALPSTIELNAIWEILTKAAELQALPPIYVMDDGTLGSGTINRSPNAVNIFDPTSSRATGSAPVGPIVTVGELNTALKLVETLVNQIMSHFFVDRLLDLNNNTRMTLGEAQIRNELRATSLGSVYSRQIAEKQIPLLKRSTELLFDKGILGVLPGSPEEQRMIATGQEPLIIPDELLVARAQGIDIFEIQLISPAARILRSEELRGIMSTWQFAATYSPVAPEFLMLLDKKRTMELVAELSGGTVDILVSDEDFEKEMQAYRESQQLRMEQQLALQNAEVAAKQGAAAQTQAQAQTTLQQGQTGLGMIA